MEFILDEVIVALWWVGSDNNLHFRSVSEEEYVNHYIKVIQSMTKKNALKKFTSKTGGKNSGMLHQAPLQLMEPGQFFFSCFDFIVRRT